MIALDLSRTGTTATTPRKDKPAGVGDAGFGVQMQKALEAGPSDRNGGPTRPHASATPPVDRAHAEDTRKRALGDARTTDRDAARDSGMEGAGPEPGASAPSAQAPGTPGAAQAETVPAGGITVATPAGTVDEPALPATVAFAGALVAGPAEPTLPGSAAQTSAAQVDTAGGTTAAPQFALQGTAGAQGTAVAATAPGPPAGGAAPGGMTSLDADVTIPGAAPGVPAAAGTEVDVPPVATVPATAAASIPNGPATATPSPSAGTAAGTVASPAHGEQATPTQPGVVVPSPVAAPSGVPGQSAGVAVPTAAPAQVHPPLAAQLTGPLFSLASGRAGEHTMTLSVTPENLGPVTVRAHIGAEGVRVELFAPNDAGREALRAILHDLKRDLASAGLGSNLDLSDRSGPDGQGAGDRKDAVPGSEGAHRRLPGPSHGTTPTTQLRFAGTPTGLDVLA